MSKQLDQSRQKPDLVLKQGYMVKQGGSIKSWKKRWFVLFVRDSDAYISYHKKKGDSPIDELNLKSATVGNVTDKEMIYIHPLNTERIYYFKADDKSTSLNEWREAIYNATRLVDSVIFSRHVVPFKEVQKLLAEEFGGNSKEVGVILRRLGFSRSDEITKEAFCTWFRFFSPLNLTLIESQAKAKKRTSSTSSKDSTFSKLPTETASLTALAEVTRENTLTYIYTLISQSWFVSYMDNQTVYSILDDQVPGTFVVRFSVNYDRSYVVTYKLDGDGCNHLLISGNEVGFTLPAKKDVYPNIYKALNELITTSIQGLALQPFTQHTKNVDKISFFGP